MNNTISLEMSEPTTVTTETFVLGENEKLVVEYLESKNSSIANQLIIKNCGLIGTAIAKLNLNPREQDEWFAEGRLALLSAINTYDVQSRKRFSTYAYHCIHNRLVQVGRMNGNYNKRVSGYMSQKTQSSFVINENSDSEYDNNDLAAIIEKSNLSDIEKMVIEYRFGMNGDDPMTYAEIGKKMNCSLQRVEQMLKNVLLRMRAVASKL